MQQIDSGWQTFDDDSSGCVNGQGLYFCAIGRKDLDDLPFFAGGAFYGGVALSRVRKNIETRFGYDLWFGIDKK